VVDVAVSDEERLQARNDLAWAIAVGGVGTVLFASLLAFAWFFAATLFLIFAGILLAVALNATTSQLGRFIALPHPVRLGMVCVVLAALFSGVIFLGGATIANESAALSDTIK
jgi:predicted PurR-regulated permease PerM